MGEFQYGTWIPSLQIGNGIIQGNYTNRVGHWSRIGHQIFVNGIFRLSYTDAQVQDALRRNTTHQEIRIGTLPYESNNGASVFNLMISNNHFVRNNRPRNSQAWGYETKTEVLSVAARSIWGSPRLRVYADERAISGSLTNINRMPLATDLFVDDLRPSTGGVFTEVRVSGVYTAFPDLSTTDPVNTPPPMITNPEPPLTTYTVQPGDTLWRLAQQFGTTIERLMEVNNLTSTVLNIGQMLLIP